MPKDTKNTKKNTKVINSNDPAYKARFAAALAACKAAVDNGQKPNYLDISKRYHVVRMTLTLRFTGKRQTRQAAHETQQLLTALEERAVLDWAMLCAAVGAPYNRQATMQKAYLMTGKSPGEKWFKRFQKRHSDMLKLCRAYGLDPKRAANFNKTNVLKHFRELKATIDKHGIPIENIYNMDEKGIQLGGGRKHDPRKYLYARTSTSHIKLKSDNLELVTIIETTCADGTDEMPVSFIGKPGDMGEWFMPHFPNGDRIGFVAASENGWTNNLLCRAWFEDTFVPAAAARNKSGKPILLIFDGHGSHLTPEMVTQAFQNNVILFLLPPKTSHMLQPLDVGIFNHVQRHWQDRSETRAVEQNAIGKVSVIREYLDIRPLAFTKSNVKDAWRRSGIHPLNPDIFTDEHYAPSRSFSTKVLVPQGVEDNFEVIPSSDESARATSDIEWEPAAMDCDETDEASDAGSDQEVELPFRTPSPVPERIRNPTSSSRRVLAQQQQQRGGSVPATPTRPRAQLPAQRADSLPPSSPPPVEPVRLPDYGVPMLPAYTRAVYRREYMDALQSSSSSPWALSRPADTRAASTPIPPTLGHVTRARSMAMEASASLSNMPDSDDVVAQRDWLLEHAAMLQEQNHRLRANSHSANAHVTLMRIENEVARAVHDTKAKKKAGKKKRGAKGTSTIMSIKQGPLTVPERYSEWEADQKAEQDALQRDKLAQAAKEQDAAAEVRARRAVISDASYVWTTTWASIKNGTKPTLVTLADDLCIPNIHDKSKAELIAAIEAHFAADVERKSNPRYAALWTRGRRRAAPAAASANALTDDEPPRAEQDPQHPSGGPVPVPTSPRAPTPFLAPEMHPLESRYTRDFSDGRPGSSATAHMGAPSRFASGDPQRHPYAPLPPHPPPFPPQRPRTPPTYDPRFANPFHTRTPTPSHFVDLHPIGWNISPQYDPNGPFPPSGSHM